MGQIDRHYVNTSGLESNKETVYNLIYPAIEISKIIYFNIVYVLYTIFNNCFI